MIEQFLQSLLEAVFTNPVESLSIGIGIVLLIFSLSNKASVGGIFHFEIDKSGRKIITFIATTMIVFGLISAMNPSLPSIASILSRLSASPISKLHKAAVHWDMPLGREAIQELRNTNNICNVALANSMESALNQSGPQAFNYVNAMQMAIQQQQPDCSYPMLDHPDQSVQAQG